MTEAEELELLELERERSMAVPVATPDVTGRAYSTPQKHQESQIAKQRRERLGREPGWMQALLGIGAKSHETLFGPTQLAAAYITGGRPGYEKKKQELAEITEAWEQSAKGSVPARIGEYGADIAYTLAPAGVGSKISKVRKAPGFIKGAFGGAGAGAGSAAVHQLQNVGRGEEVSPFGAVVETGVSAVTGGLGGKVEPLTRGAAEKIIQTATKLGKKIKGQKVMNKAQAERYFENYGSWRNILKSEAKISKHHDKLSNDFDDLINKVAKGKQVDIKQATVDARNDILEKSTRGEVDVVEIPKINKAIDEFEKMLDPLIDKKTGKIDFKIAQNFKRNTLDPRAKWDKPNVIGDVNVENIPKARAARDVRRKLAKEMEKELPQMRPLNKEFSEMAEIEPFIEQTAERFMANRGFSPQDLATLAAGGLGVAGGAYFENPGAGALVMLPFIISRAQRSPAAAQLFYDLSKFAGSTPVKESSKVLAQMGRSEVDRWYKQKRTKLDKLITAYEKADNPKVQELIKRNIEKELQNVEGK